LKYGLNDTEGMEIGLLQYKMMLENHADY
jgi:hypothetical protein